MVVSFEVTSNESCKKKKPVDTDFECMAYEILGFFSRLDIGVK